MDRSEKFMKVPIDVNEGLWEFCKYQNELLKAYKEFIERTILVKILEKYTPATDTGNWWERECRVHEIIIPGVKFKMLETPNVKRQWEFLTWDTPLVKPEIYLNLVYKAAEEQKKDADSN